MKIKKKKEFSPFEIHKQDYYIVHVDHHQEANDYDDDRVRKREGERGGFSAWFQLGKIKKKPNSSTLII